MSTIQGNYEGEGANVSGSAAKTLVGDVPATNTATSTGPAGTMQSVAIDRRRRLRVSSESARSAVAINYGSGDQILTYASRGIYITTTGNLAVRFADDTSDVTLTGLNAGQWYPFSVAIVRQTSSTAAGFLLF